MTEQLYPSVQHTGRFDQARCMGIFRYHFITLGKIVLWVLAILLGSQILSMLIPILTYTRSHPNTYMSGGVSSDASTAIFVALICGCIVAGRSTRFLLRFGTSRFSVWLCNILSLLVAMIVLLAGSLLISIAQSYAVLWLGPIYPDAFFLRKYTADGIVEGAHLLNTSLPQAFADLPQQLLWLAEWVCLYYLLGCCFRRSKGWTLAVVIGVPLALMLLMVIPAVQEAVDTARYATEGEVMMLGLKWMQWIAKAAQFITEQWQWIQLGAAVVSLPLSYLCMRSTKQP